MRHTRTLTRDERDSAALYGLCVAGLNFRQGVGTFRRYALYCCKGAISDAARHTGLIHTPHRYKPTHRLYRFVVQAKRFDHASDRVLQDRAVSRPSLSLELPYEQPEERRRKRTKVGLSTTRPAEVPRAMPG